MLKAVRAEVWAVPLLASCGISAWLVSGVVGHVGSSMVGAPPDQELAVWGLGWIAFAVTHGVDPLVTTYASPGGHPINLMLNTVTPLYGALLLPVTRALGPVVSYNLAMFLSLVASATVAMVVLSRYVHHRPAAWMAGALFAFSPLALGEATAGHLFWSALWPLPLSLWLLDEIVARQRHRPILVGGALGLVAALTLMVNEEELADAFLVGAVVLVVLAALHVGQLPERLGYIGKSLAATTVVFLAVDAWPLTVEFFGPGRPTRGFVGTPFSAYQYSAKLLGLVLPTPSQGVAPTPLADIARNLLPYAINPAEGQVYIGIPVLLALIWACWSLWSQPWVRVGSLLAVVSLVIALDPFSALQDLPLLGRATPVRLVLLSWLGIATVLAVLFDRLWERASARGRIGTIAIASVVVLSVLPRSALQVDQVAMPEALIGDTLPAGQLAAVLPAPTVPVRDAVLMVWQAESGFRYRLPWGYLLQPGSSGNLVLAPSSITATTAATIVQEGRGGEGVRLRVRAQLTAWGVKNVAVGPCAHQGQVVAFFAGVLRAPPRWVDGVAIWTLRRRRPTPPRAT